MTAITITDLENAALDVATIGGIANSTSAAVTDRLGQSRPTMTALAAEYPAASANAAAALVSKNAAGVSETNALASKVAAESARDAANAIGKVFTTTALGVAGTNSGQSFCVLAVDGFTLIVYTNAAGIATEVTRYYTKAYQDVILDGTYSTRTGYAQAWLDSAGNFAMGITLDGHFVLGAGGDVSERLDTLDESAPIVATGYESSGFAWSWQDSAGNHAGGIADDGSLISKGQNLSTQAAVVALNTKWRMSDANLVAWGDSLTQGAGGTPWPQQLATLLSRAVYNGGVGGQGSPAIACRQGGVKAFLTITGNTIPASGGVAVTAYTIRLLDSQSAQSISGTLGGIPGTLSRATGDVYTFTRTTSGTARVIETLTPFIVDTADRDFSTTLFWVGTNTVYTDPSQVIADVTKMVGYLKPTNKKFVVMSLLNGGNEPARYSGGTVHTNTLIANNAFRVAWPENYLDTRSILIRSYNPSIPQDVIDFGNDVTPTSLSSDGIHLNTAGYAVIAAAVQQFLNDKGW